MRIRGRQCFQRLLDYEITKHASDLTRNVFDVAVKTKVLIQNQAQKPTSWTGYKPRCHPKEDCN